MLDRDKSTMRTHIHSHILSLAISH